MKIIFFILSIMAFPVLACDGGMFNSPISIPEHSILANDMTEEIFKTTVKKFETFFSPILNRTHNADLQLYGSWKSNTVNAFAEQDDRKMMITVYGGLARHEAITTDGLVAVLCHELGHHLGGYPKKSTNKWSSAEGQSDYFATMKCLRVYWGQDNNQAAMAAVIVPELVKNECAQTYASESERALCHRMSFAGRSVALMIQALDHDSWIPRFETPEPEMATHMVYTHPFGQCRLDTFFQGAICPVKEQIDFDEDRETVGACHQRNGNSRGLRPGCWFVPRL